MVMIVKGWLKMAVMYAVCHEWVSEDITMRLWDVFQLKDI